MPVISASEKFSQEVERALVHLYDPDFLRRSPLVCLFDLAERENPAGELRNILLNAITALKPEESTPAASNAWRYFQVLNYRFVEQSSQREVAADLLLSVRQLRRYEVSAKNLLAQFLWTRRDLQDRARCLEQETSPDEVAYDLANQVESRDSELERVARMLPVAPLKLSDLLSRIMETVQPYLRSSAVSVRCVVPEPFPALIAQETAARQMLLHLVMMAARCAPGGNVQIKAGLQPHSTDALVEISAVPAGSSDSARVQETDIALAHRLSEIAGGALTLKLGAPPHLPFAAEIRLPIANQVPVLVVDDNRDTLALIQRYLANTRYHFVGTPNPLELLQLAEDNQAAVVVLDVMLPGIDGWEVLSRLRENPKWRGVPVIVSTILPHADLAHSLGAAEFLPKPVNRERLLAALDRHTSPVSPVS
jgi:CheY-like chemotaxis protein